MTRVLHGAIRHGHILGFSGVGPQSRIIQATTFSWVRGINHVAIACRGDDAEREVWESTTGLDVPCMHMHRVVRGVQCHPLGERLEYARDHRQLVWHYPLRVALGPSAALRLENLLYGKMGVPYDYAGAIWARSCGFGWLAHRLRNREALASVFCSELVALALRGAGVFNTPNASMWNPAFLLRTLEYLGVLAAPRLIVEGRRAA